MIRAGKPLPERVHAIHGSWRVWAPPVLDRSSDQRGAGGRFRRSQSEVVLGAPLTERAALLCEACSGRQRDPGVECFGRLIGTGRRLQRRRLADNGRAGRRRWSDTHAALLLQILHSDSKSPHHLGRPDCPERCRDCAPAQPGRRFPSRLPQTRDPVERGRDRGLFSHRRSTPEQQALWVPAQDVFVTAGDSPPTFADHQAELERWRGSSVLDRVKVEPEATYEQFASLWEDMGSPGYRHPRAPEPGHIVCLTWDSAISKFGIDRAGGVWNDLGNPDRFRFWFEFGDLTKGVERSCWTTTRSCSDKPFQGNGCRTERRSRSNGLRPTMEDSQ